MYRRTPHSGSKKYREASFGLPPNRSVYLADSKMGAQSRDGTLGPVWGKQWEPWLPWGTWAGWGQSDSFLFEGDVINSYNAYWNDGAEKDNQIHFSNGMCAVVNFGGSMLYITGKSEVISCSEINLRFHFKLPKCVFLTFPICIVFFSTFL